MEGAWSGIRKRQWYRDNQKLIVEQIRGSGPSLEPPLPIPEGDGQDGHNIALQGPIDSVQEQDARNTSTDADSASPEQGGSQ